MANYKETDLQYMQIRLDALREAINFQRAERTFTRIDINKVIDDFSVLMDLIKGNLPQSEVPYNVKQARAILDSINAMSSKRPLAGEYDT